MNTLTKQDLEKLILEEIDKMAPVSPALNEEAAEAPLPQEETDPTQQYFDWIVLVQEAAREALQDIEGGEEPWKAAVHLTSLARGLTSEDFYHHFHG